MSKGLEWTLDLIDRGLKNTCSRHLTKPHGDVIRMQHSVERMNQAIVEEDHEGHRREIIWQAELRRRLEGSATLPASKGGNPCSCSASDEASHSTSETSESS